MDWLIADSHFGHSNIIKYCNRPFSSSEEMDDVLIKNINECVKPNDLLWHLGDFCFGPRDVEGFYRVAAGYRQRINCQNIIIIHGNHDPDPFSHRRDERDKANKFYKLFSEDYALRNTSINGRRVTLCHYALARWDKSHRGAINLYGHSHADIEPWMDQIMPGRKSMDVGVDNIAKILGKYRPISFPEIVKIMDERPGFLEHHNDER
jgi:calcineurin-like phosphoesterase family protein